MTDMFPPSRRKARGSGPGPAILIVVLLLALAGGAYWLLGGGDTAAPKAATTAAQAGSGDPVLDGLAEDRRAFDAEMKAMGLDGPLSVAALAADVRQARAKSSKAQQLVGRYRMKVGERVRQARHEVTRQYPGEAARNEALAAFDARITPARDRANERWALLAEIASARGQLVQTLAYTEWALVGDEVRFHAAMDSQRMRDDLDRVRKAEKALADFDAKAAG